MNCPTCTASLTQEHTAGARTYVCANDRGVAVTISVLRKLTSRESVLALWRMVRDEGAPTTRACPGCERPLVAVTASRDDTHVELDGCPGCQLIWFDRDELDAFAPPCERPDAESDGPGWSPEAAEAAALGRILAEDARREANDLGHAGHMIRASRGFGYRRGQRLDEVIDALHKLFRT